MSLLDIHVLGSPILREQTEPVVEVSDEIRRLSDDMFETMYAAQGIGLAAPQVGRLERMFVCDVDGARYTFINPELVLAEGSDKAEEGCLSIPEIFGEVTRPATVRMKGLDLEGNPFEIDASELLARCLQHELDHLNGRLFIDHLSLLKRRNSLARWDRMKSQFPALRRTLSPTDIATHHGGDEL
ncbi:MAG TPA: peptide deformylase [Gemmatimonadales bacterium]|nr:peptide deformylase [Gemmatimonadales bacterium]